MQHDFDLDEIRKILEQGMAICVLMTNFSADADIRGDSVNALGIEMHDKFHEIFEKLGF